MDLSGYSLQALKEDDGFALYRGQRIDSPSFLVVAPIRNRTKAEGTDRLEREYGLANELDGAWAAQPLELASHHGRTVLLLADAGGDLLEAALGVPAELPRFLEIAAGLAAALRELHGRGLVHNDVRPANVLIDAEGCVRLTGFGKATRLAGGHAVAPPTMSGSALAYMAPEHTGRMNRPIDARSDLYALGVTLYRMITGDLPFAASDPLDLIHCHVARQPQPPSERNPQVPLVVERIILKLLAKPPEDRYQSAGGLEHDLRHGLSSWHAHRRLDIFPLAMRDRPTRLHAPARLYGREAQIAELAGAFGRVAARGHAELVLISGHAGSGKSSLVGEFQKAAAKSAGLFAVGKADQYMHGPPYAALAAALQSLVRQLLSKDDDELEPWRLALRGAVGLNGCLMINLAPELSHIIGPQPPAQELSPNEERGRFHSVLKRFLGVFSRPENPLTLFFDDLQWLDPATLDILERLIVDRDVKGMLFVGAYRDNDIHDSHPLARTLRAVGAAGGPVVRIALGPLEGEALQQLVAATLGASEDQCAPLAALVLERTAGNPFFAVQLLARLAEEGVLTVKADATAWQWSLERTGAAAISESLAGLMAGKLNRLAGKTLEAVKKLACLGDKSSSAKLAVVLDAPEDGVHDTLLEAISEGLVTRRDGAYSFAHDRIQEAAYALIPELERPAEHLRIGRALWASPAAQPFEEQVFEIASHIDRGSATLTSRDERERAAELHLAAGRQARNSTAYISALTYLVKAGALLAEDRWERCRRLAFDIEFHQAECEFLTGGHAAAEMRLSILAPRAASFLDQAAVTRMLITIYTTIGDPKRAVEVGLACLLHVGIVLTPPVAEDLLRDELDEMKRLLGGRSIEQLIELPSMSDPNWIAAMDVLASLIMPALITDNTLEEALILRMANLSLRHGNCDASCYAYAQLNVVLGLHFGDYQAGFQFGQLGCELVDHHGLDRYKARVYSCFSCYVLSWVKHLPSCLALARRAVEAAGAVGDLVFESATCRHVVAIVLVAGTRLADVQREAEHYLALSRKMGFQIAADGATSQLMLVRELRGLAEDGGPGEAATLERQAFERHLEDGGAASVLPLAWYWIHRMQACLFAQDYPAAIKAADKAGGLLNATRSFMDVAEYHFYGALVQAAACDSASFEERQRRLECLKAHHRQITVWAVNCPENASNRAALVQAEIARLENCEIDAQRCYEDAVRLAHEHGFVQNEAMASELAARFHAARGLGTAADAFLRNARSCYLRWGAEGKVRQLDRSHPQLADEPRLRAENPTGMAQVEQVDLAALVRMSQAISGEIVLDRLIERLMLTVVEHAGAVRGLLLLLRDGEMRIAAEAATDRHGVAVTLRDQSNLSTKVPASILNHVMHTHDAIILGDAVNTAPYSADLYVREHRPRSVLCLPMTKPGQLVGVLYLENDLSPDLFTPDRLTVLRFLVSQAAVSIENAELFLDIQQAREQARRGADELRRSLDMLPAMVWIGAPDGSVLSVNKQWTDFTGVSQEAALSGAWLSAFHPEDAGKVTAKWLELLSTGLPGEIEARMLRSDGIARTFLMRGTPLHDDQGNVVRWYGTNMDIDDLKRAEETQAALARAGRLTAMGELTVSIAHEVNQPLMAIVTNAATCLQWLKDERLNVPEARQAAERIIRDGHRAGDVVASIRALARKSVPKMAKLDLNEVVREVLALMRGESHRRAIAIETDLSVEDGFILGDRIQMQQVILNLIMNGIEAIDTTKDQPRLLRVSSAWEASGDVAVVISDTGPGLDPAAGEKIFETFFTTKPEGIGMGLSICRSIVQAHGGRLWASPNVPCGSIFRFTVPVLAKEHAFAPAK